MPLVPANQHEDVHSVDLIISHVLTLLLLVGAVLQDSKSG